MTDRRPEEGREPPAPEPAVEGEPMFEDAVRYYCTTSGYSFVVERASCTTSISGCPWHYADDCLSAESPPIRRHPEASPGEGEHG